MKARKHAKRIIDAPRPQGALRLNVRMRDMGLASRREADALIESGKVYVNRKRAALGTPVVESDTIEVRGKTKDLVYLAYHKARGLPTQGEPGEDSVVTRFAADGISPVGRLDKDSSGLLILTNDGLATAKVLGDDIEKEYLVTTKEAIRAGIPAIFAKGMDTRAFGTLRPAKATLVNERKLRITLLEGKKHQVRVMLAELGLTVSELVRTRVGGVLLGKLPKGQARELTATERASLSL